MKNNYLDLLAFLLIGLIIGETSVSAESGGAGSSTTRLEVLSSYSELITAQNILEGSTSLVLKESKGFPEGMKLFPSTDQVYFDAVAKVLFDSAESYNAYYFSEDSCPGWNASGSSPFVGANILKYTTRADGSSPDEVTLQISAFRSWRENGDCKMLPAITSVTWVAQ